MIKTLLFLFLFPFYSFGQTDYKNAADEIYADILQADNSFVSQDSQLWVRAEKIVCLSGISPKIWDHQYSGLSYKPTVEEIKKWKKWFEENKKNIKYSIDSQYGIKIIILENPSGEIKRSNCLYN